MQPNLMRHTPRISRQAHPNVPQWESGESDGRSLIVLVPLFFICCFVIYFLLEITLISLLEASQWIVLFGALSFLILYLLHQRLRLDLTDGLIFSIFGLAPVFMAAMLTVNWYFSSPYSETHRIMDVELNSSSAVIHLEKGAYEDFYRIRRFDAHEVGRSKEVTFFLGEGLLGWTVKHGHQF